MKIKTCTRCQIEKPASEFYKDRKNKTDGLSGYCKDCKRQRWIEWYHEGGKESVTQYKTSERGREVRRRANQRYSKTVKGKATIRRVKRCPERTRVYNIVTRAVQDGDLPPVSSQKCLDCGGKAENYHHENYSQPLDVTPLCLQCHTKRHH